MDKCTNEKKTKFFLSLECFFSQRYISKCLLCDALFVRGLCCSWAVTNLILKQGTEVLHILDRYQKISRGASSEHSVGSGTEGAGNPLPWNGRELHKSVEFCISHRRGNFNGKEGTGFQAYLSLCHAMTSEIAPLNHVVSITLQERRLLTAVSLALLSSLGCFQPWMRIETSDHCFAFAHIASQETRCSSFQSRSSNCLLPSCSLPSGKLFWTQSV